MSKELTKTQKSTTQLIMSLCLGDRHKREFSSPALTIDHLFFVFPLHLFRNQEFIVRGVLYVGDVWGMIMGPSLVSVVRRCSNTIIIVCCFARAGMKMKLMCYCSDLHYVYVKIKIIMVKS